MNIMIMCGGRGSRLAPATDDVPKPLVPFHRETILDLKIQEYLRQGFREFVLCVGYKGDLIRRAVAKYEDRARFHFSDAGERAGILERIAFARDLFDDRVFVTYGDTFADLEIERAVDVHLHGGNAGTIVVAPIENPFGLVEFDEDHKVLSFREKPVLNYYIGQAVLEKSALDLAPTEVIERPDGEGIVDFYGILIALGRLGLYYHDGFDLSFNTEQERSEAEAKLLGFYTPAKEPA